MDGFTASFLSGLAASLASQVIAVMGRRLRDSIVATPRERALKKCFEVGVVAFVASATTDIKDEVDLLSTIFRDFFDDPDAGAEILPLLKGATVSHEEMRYVFKHAGYDEEKLPTLDFDKALSAFEYAFLTQASQETELRGELRTGVALQQLGTQKEIRDALNEMLLVLKQANTDTLLVLNGCLSALARQQNKPLEFRFPEMTVVTLRDWERHYLKTLINRLDSVDLTQIDDREPSHPDLQEPLRITEVFTSLYLKNLRQSGKVKLRDLIEKRDLEKDSMAPDREDEAKPVSAMEAIAVVPRLVILGQPGGGKSTLVNHLACTLARKQLGQKLEKDGLTGWQDTTALIPVSIVLRRFAAEIPEGTKQGEAHLVWDYLKVKLKKIGCEEAFEQLKHHLTEKGGVIFLDGLDEVSETDEARKRTVITQAITAFAGPLDKCKVVVTCREYAYKRDDNWRLPEHTFPVVELDLFKGEQIEYFINNWYRVVGPKKAWDSDKCIAEARKLNDAVNSLSHLQELAQYPLLLTLMAQVHGKDGYLPRDRADLYEKAVNLLLERWENRITIELDGSREVEPALIMQLGVRTEVLRNALEQVAFAAHERQEKEKTRDDRAADIGKQELREELHKSLGSWDKAELVVDYIENRAGIIQQQVTQIYTFPHRTFQEYLTATYILRQSDFDAMLRDRVRRDMIWWREVFLLACGTQKKTPRNISDIVDSLLPAAPAKNTKPKPDKFAQAQVAAQALVETEFSNAADSDNPDEPGRFRLTYQRIQNWLLACVSAHRSLNPEARAQAGIWLSQLGDPRKQVTGIEHMLFCFIPAGSFWLGSERNEEEKPFKINDTLTYDYWMSKYPVTNAQFNQFIDAGGYKNPDYWPEARAQKVWRKGKVKGLWDDEFRDKPAKFGTHYGLAGHPVVGITWYEALAFARWLTDISRAEGWLHATSEIRLPSEAEWEKAARGGIEIPKKAIFAGLKQIAGPPASAIHTNSSPERDYPWDGEADGNLANFDKSGVHSTSSVGCFAEGRSPYGCQEMSGNVWEWTRTLWGKDVSEADFPYPYEPGDGREDLSAKKDIRRVLRGGSFGGYANDMRCSCRFRLNPDYGYDFIGFRVVLSPFISEL